LREGIAKEMFVLWSVLPADRFRETTDYCSKTCRNVGETRAGTGGGSKPLKRKGAERQFEIPIPFNGESPGPIEIKLPEGRRGRVWTSDRKDRIGEGLQWTLAIDKAYDISRAELKRERRKWPTDIVGGRRRGHLEQREAVLQAECFGEEAAHDGALPNDAELKYHEDGYPKLPPRLDRRPIKLENAA
jgi:hypothetical protein